MSGREGKVSQRIRSFVEHPVTNLVKGLTLLIIGLSDASHTFRDDITRGQLRLGHGLILIGLFSILASLPHFVEGLEASERYMESREEPVPDRPDANHS